MRVYVVCVPGHGWRIILPQSALDHLARLNISYPMLFEAPDTKRSYDTHRQSH